MCRIFCETLRSIQEKIQKLIGPRSENENYFEFQDVVSYKVHKNGWNPPFNSHQLLSIFFTLFLSLLFYGVLVPGLYPLAQLIFIILYSVLLIINIGGFIAVVSIDSSKDGIKDHDSEEVLAVCKLCNINMLTTTYHCFKCNKCIDFYAAHSKWHNNCIGKKNYRLYVISSSCAALLCGVIIETVITLVISYFANYQTMYQWLDWLYVFTPVSDEIWMGTILTALSLATFLLFYIVFHIAPFCACSCRIKHAQLLNFAVDIPMHHPLKSNQYDSLLLQCVKGKRRKSTVFPEKIIYERDVSRIKETCTKESVLQILNSPSTSSQHISFKEEELPSKSRFIGLLEIDEVISTQVNSSSSSEKFSDEEITECQDDQHVHTYEDKRMIRDTIKRHKLENNAWSPVSETDLSPNRIIKFRPSISPGLSSLRSSASDRTLTTKKNDSSRASSPKSILSSPPRKEILNRERCLSP